MKFTEESLEQAVIELFKAENYQHINGMMIHKEMSDVLLRGDIKAFLLNRYSNDEITNNEIESIIRQIEILPSSSLYESNKAIIKMISDGFVLKREDRSKKDLFIQLIDFDPDNIEDNIFKIVNQLEIQGYEKRIPDSIVYVNGLPLVVLEFKSAIKENTTIKDAFTQLTIRYRRDIPELFKYNAFCVISDGVNNKSGSLFAPYDFFYAWRKIEGNEPFEKDGIDSLITMVKGLFNQKRFLDVVRNFIYFPDTSTKEEKIVPRYPQYYAATKLLKSIKQNMKPQGSGKGGTYFGATGCGKSFTMLYLTRLLMRNIYFQSPTIVLITDRTDLDDQLSAQFTNAKGFIGDDQVISVGSRAELKAYLQSRKSGGVFLTTIHKFNEDIDLLTERTNVICISDEAHRSQINLDQKIKITKKGVEKKYGFAKHLHNSLPNATYVGFTGTPIDATMDVFGEVEDSYTMKESVYDDITVRIVYEGRAAKVNLNEAKLKEIEDYYKKCETDGANEHQIEESKKALTQMDVILGDPKRLQLVAEDFIAHYEKRIEERATVKGKVMFVASNRQIAYDLYKRIIALRPQWAEVRDCDEGAELTEKERKEIKPIEKIKMVMTRNTDDIKQLYDLLGTKDYRKELDRQYKNEKSNFKIAIVVDMWLTGFDVPFLDTIYIDKPIQQHSLIQTISRVNRVYEGKEMGLVVDYIGIKSNMNVALKKYGVVDGDNFDGTDKAVVIVKDQLDLLAKIFYNFDSTAYFKGTPLEQLNCLNQAAEFAQQTAQLEKRFLAIVKKLRSAYNLCLSSEDITQTERDYIHFYFAIKSIIHKLTVGLAADTAQMNEKVRLMIQEALISDGVEEVFKLDKNDLKNNVDVFSDEYMEKIDKIKLPNTKIKLLQKLLSKAIEEFKKTNRIKGVDFSKRFKKLIERYNERKDFQAMQSDVLDEVADQFADLFAELVKERNSFKDLGIDFEEKAFYDILKAISKKYEFEYPHNKLIKLSQEIKKIIADKARYTDWSYRDDIKAELKVDLILTLAENDYPPVPKDEIFKEIFEQAENFKKYSVD
ncbi:HsdR family type I site-specific deoxyribonuclease [Priestia aryabhattai]|uniref:type I restriction endonuclease subunit R n=1 Tax=Priestia aryabhattai TaxID=412384 RepID=UPI00234E9867|nr:HsdR family type I site-specific deoxyribonuclease [Priestia aryabhattai]MDC7767281.1 HsdR family type I site-specific deoxyribonuclease [Priestia aryabhattai]